MLDLKTDRKGMLIRPKEQLIVKEILQIPGADLIEAFFISQSVLQPDYCLHLRGSSGGKSH